MDFDDILVQYVGEFGYYQKWIYFLLCLLQVFGTTSHMVGSIFLLNTPRHRCELPGWQNDTYAIQNEAHRQLINMTIPPSLDATLDFSQCTIYSNNISTVCKNWVYERNVFKSTVTTDQNIVCNDGMKTSHASMVFFGGVLVGSFLFGMLSDLIGRKKTMVLTISFLLVSTLAVAWSPSFTVFVILRFIVGMSCAGVFLSSFILGMEIVGPSKRLWVGNVSNFFFAIGLIFLCGVAYALREWKYIEIAVSAPSVFYLSYWWLIPESPRWLITKGRLDEAKEIIRTMAKKNNVTLPDKVLCNMEAVQSPSGSILQLFRTRKMCVRSFIIFFNWAVVTLGYYGLSLNTGNLSGDFYLNFLLSGLVEFPAYFLCLVFLDRIGRKKLHMVCFIGGGLACISTIFTILYLDDDLQAITITLAMVGKLGIAAAFAVIYVWTAEIYPTAVRNAALGASSAFARVGGMISPYIADLNKVVDGHLGKALPLVIFGGLSVLAGLLSIMLPETMNQKLPETIKDEGNLESARQEKQLEIFIRGSPKDYETPSETYLESHRF